MTLNEYEGYFFPFETVIFITHKVHFYYNVFTHKLESEHGLWFNLYCPNEGVFKVTDIHLYFRSGVISETVLDRDIVTTGHEQEMIYGLLNCRSCNDLGYTSRSFFK